MEVIERQRQMFDWIEAWLFPQLFKPDLSLAWFFAQIKQYESTDYSFTNFDSIADQLVGPSDRIAELKAGYRSLIAFLQQCGSMVPENYMSLSMIEKMAINEKIMDGIINSSSRMFESFDERSLVEEADNYRKLWFRRKEIAPGLWIHR